MGVERMRKVTRVALAIFAALCSLSVSAQAVYPYFGPAAGILKGVTTSGVTTAAAASDFATLFGCAANQVVFDSNTGSLTCSTKLTWTDSSALLTLGNVTTAGSLLINNTITTSGAAGAATGTANIAAPLQANTGAVIIAAGQKAGGPYGGYQMGCKFAANGDLFCMSQGTPIWEFIDPVAGAGEVQEFALQNDTFATTADGLVWGLTSSVSTSCNIFGAFNYAIPANVTTATKCSFLDAGGAVARDYPLVLGVNVGQIVGIFDTLSDALLAGTTPKEYLYATNPAGTAVNTTLGDSTLAGSITNIVGGSAANTRANGVPILTGYTGTSGSIGGGALAAGACTSGTVAITGAATTMVAVASPNTYPGDGSYWDAQVTAANTVTVKVCAAIALTPAASTYNVRVLQ